MNTASVVLVVSESSKFLRKISRMLSRCGLHALSHRGGSRLLPDLRTEAAGLLIVDCDPGSDLWKRWLEEIAQPLGIPLVVTSRLADERLWSEVLNFGGFDVLAQPLEPAEVVRVTASALRSRRPFTGRVRNAAG